MNVEDRKVVVIGVDGLSFGLLAEAVEEGRLPTFRRLVEQGAWGALRSTILPVTPVAWTTSYTGLNPGRTGIYGFVRRSGLPGSWEPVWPGEQAGAEVWEVVSELGRRAVVIGMPFSAVRPIEGIMIGGHFSTSPLVHPPEIEGLLTETLDYQFVCGLFNSAEAYDGAIANRFGAASYFARHEAWDLLMVGFEHLEVAHHFHMVGNRRLVDQVLIAFDRQLGAFLDSLPDDKTVLLYSDHGHEIYPWTFCLPTWLAEEGAMVLRTDDFDEIFTSRRLDEAAVVEARHETWIKRKAMWGIFMLGEWVKERFPNIKYWLPFLRYPEGARRPDLVDHFLERIIDVEASQVLPYPSGSGNYGALYLTPAARARLGSEGSERFLDSLTDKLRRIEHQGRPLVRKVWRKEALYHGEYLDEIFDLVFEVAEGIYVSAEEKDIARRKVLFQAPVSHHVLEGFFLAAGPGIKRGHETTGEILDIMPTILYTLGLPLPHGLDGSVLEDVFLPEWLEERPVTYTDIIRLERGREQTTYSEEELRAVEERLKSLGYLD